MSYRDAHSPECRVCTTCGALVCDPQVHDRWHATAPATEYLRELRHDVDGAVYTEVWATPPPAAEVRYQVLRDSWNVDATERTIHEVQPVLPR